MTDMPVLARTGDDVLVVVPSDTQTVLAAIVRNGYVGKPGAAALMLVKGAWDEFPAETEALRSDIMHTFNAAAWNDERRHIKPVVASSPAVTPPTPVRPPDGPGNAIEGQP